MTYNVLNGGAGREAAIVEVIRTATPDVVVVPEVRQLCKKALLDGGPSFLSGSVFPAGLASHNRRYRVRRVILPGAVAAVGVARPLA